MRKFSLFAIIMLCLAILVVDGLAFYWLRSITKLIDAPAWIVVVNFAFWVFTVGLISAILILKVRLDSISVHSKQLWISSLYGLTVSSFIPKILFVIVVSILHGANFVLVDKASLIVIAVIGLLAGFLPFFAILFGIFKTVYSFKIHHKTIRFEHLKPSFGGLQIVQISDLHLGSFNYRYTVLDRAVKIINDLEPDIIVFTGDLVNNYAWELKGWDSVLSKLTAKGGKFAILGNHDYGDYSEWKTEGKKQQNFENIKDFFPKIGFKLLLNESKIITFKGQDIALIGVENWGKPPFKQYGNLEKALENVKDISLKILLSHDPTHWTEEVVNQNDIALTLAGHTHGMQAGIDLGNIKWSPIQYKLKHWAGLYQQSNQSLYVNRGLGWLGFPGRIGMRPEITVIELE